MSVDIQMRESSSQFFFFFWSLLEFNDIVWKGYFRDKKLCLRGFSQSKMSWREKNTRESIEDANKDKQWKDYGGTKSEGDGCRL